MPLISGLIAAGTAIAGAVEASKAGGRQQKALTQQEQIAQQEMADKQKAFDQAEAFYTPYTKSGSPFLQNIQAAAAAQNAQQGNNAAGQFREQMGQTGLGFGPSGSTAAGLANIGSGMAASGAGNYLANLLNNEQIKFQAQQGLTSAGAMAGASQNQPNVSAQLPYQSLGSGLSGLSGVLANLLGQGNQVPGRAPGDTPGSLPPSVFGPVPGVPIPPPTVPQSGPPKNSGAPTTGGWSI